MLKNSYSKNKWTQKHIDSILKTAQDLWEDKIEFGEIEETGAPFPEFNWYVKLYTKFKINFHYDRGILSIELPIDGVFHGLSGIVNEPVVIGFDSLVPQNLYHNFKVLDRYLLQKMSEEE